MLQFHKILLQNQNVCEMAKFTLHIYIGAKLGGSGGSAAPAVFLVS